MRVLNEVWGALRAHSRAGPTFHDGNSNFLILRTFYLSCLGKLTLYLNPLVPQLITPNRRLRWDISSISALRPRPRAGVAKRSVCSGIDEIRWSRGPGVDSRPGFEIFGGRTRAEWLGRLTVGARSWRQARAKLVMGSSPRPLSLTLETPRWLVIKAQPVRYFGAAGGLNTGSLAYLAN